MSTASSLTYRWNPEVIRAGTEAAQRLARLHAVKVLLAIAIGVCFWFSVPYSFPIQIDADHLKAAAAEADSFQGSLSRELAVPIVGVLAAFALYRLPKRAKLRFSSKLFAMAVAYTAWVAVSLLWSTDPSITFKRLIVFLINVLFLVALARLLSMKELAVFGFVCTGTVAMMALFADCVLLHAFRPWDPDYRFMGVMTANFQAMNLYVCLICGMTLLLARPSAGRWLLPLLLLLAALLFLTRARIGTFLFVAATVPVCLRFGKSTLSAYGRALCLLGLLCVAVPAVVFVGGRSGAGALQEVFMMGRKDTENTSNLSNRAPLWSELSDSVGERPLLGFGFDAFWTPQRVEQISVDQGWVVPHAHNSYLDQTLSLGFVGSILYAIVLLGATVQAWRSYVKRRTESELMPALLLSWLVLLGLTESIPISPYLPTLIAYSCVVRTFLQPIDVEGEGHRMVDAGRDLTKERPNRRSGTGHRSLPEVS